MKIVGFIGTISAGKASIIREVKAILNEKDIWPEPVVEDVKLSANLVHPEYYLFRQILFVNEVTNRIIRAKDRGGELSLVHRCIYDGIAFMQAYVKAGLVSSEEARSQIKSWKENAERLVDYVVLVKTPAEVAFERARKKFGRSVQDEKGNENNGDKVFHRDFFGHLDSCYRRLEKN